MARKLSGGLVGEPSVGAINVAPTAVVTAAVNQDITIQPTGTGNLVITSNASLLAQSDVRFYDNDNSNYLAFQSPATVSSNVTWTLPAADGTSGQVLSTNASGTLSWITPNVTISNNTSDATTHYPTFTTATTGTVTTVRVADSKLTFVPSTGTLTTTALVESSSITLKENFNPITDALDKISNLKAWIYDRKDGSQKNEAGLVAEEVYDVIPNVVTLDNKGNPAGINYTRLSAYLIEAVKTLKNEIAELKSKH
jgi:hypothetical protein